MKKITISIPCKLLTIVDEIAKEKKITRSKVVSSCLREIAEKRYRKKMEEVYKALAHENLKFAEEAVLLANETLPEWTG
jgi:metal-responsive CopG/Arc/MetJ family transcriptional regulator